MKKFRKWLIDRFLPRWAYESLLEELAAANKKQEELRQTVEPVSYTHLTLPTTICECRSRWSPDH